MTEFLRGKPLQLSGDGRCDSPGHNAKYCTYSLTDSVTDLILDYNLVQVTETGSSVAMEKDGLQRCLSNVLSSGLQIESIATDRHTSVGALMKKKYHHIEHQYDVWHLAKCIGKKLMQKGKTKKCEKLLPWIQSITNHLWWCAQTCNKDPELLCAKWVSVVHHISNVHQWGDGDGLFDKCAHGTLSCEEIRAKLWLEPSSPSHTELCNIVLKNTLLRDIKKLSWFQHTGSLEVFHSLITKYCPKRKYFSYMEMQARTELAIIIDHNHNTDRDCCRYRFLQSAYACMQMKCWFLYRTTEIQA